MSARAINASSIFVEWFVFRPNGVLITIEVNATSQESDDKQHARLPPSSRTRLVDGLSPYTTYEITVAAQTTVGWSSPGRASALTNESSTFRL